MLQFSIDQEKCVSCGECVSDCAPGILTMQGDYPAVIEEKEKNCIGCQHCLTVCPTGALSILGYTPENSLPIKGAFPSAQQLETLIKGRRSCRRFKNEPVDSAVIDELLEITAHAPTGVNNQGVLFTVVEDQGTMEKLRKNTYEGIRTALTNGTIAERAAFFKGVLNAWDEAGKDIIFRDAPHLVVVSSPKKSSCPEADCYIALSYFELMAQTKNVGTVWNGIANWALGSVAPEVGKRLGIPDDHKMVYMMVFGTPDVRYFRTVQREAKHVNKVVW